MDTLSYKTISANKATVTKEWVIVDATDQVLGRLGAKVAKPYSLGYDVESASVNCSNRDIHGGYHTRFTEDTHSGEPNSQ